MKKVKTGRVVSNRMDKSIVVEVEERRQHSIYRKFIRRHFKFYAHDEGETASIGDIVRIEECRPYSRQKHWRLLEIVRKAEV